MRLEGWESRLAEVLEAARAQTYRLGEHDCWTVAVAVVRALTGRDLADAYAPYSTRAGALREIRRYGDDLRCVGDKLLGKRIVPLSAMRGDIVAFDDGEELHFGVCTGPRVQLTLAANSGSIPLTDYRCVAAWRVE